MSVIVKPVPTIGRIVHYVLSEADIHEIRATWEANKGKLAFRSWMKAGDHMPLVVTEVDPNDTHGTGGQVLISGNFTLWRPSLAEDPTGEKPLSWHWPEGTREAAMSLEALQAT
ncbi:hypothetical protein [Deinococcus cellulosilyticus]|uniref:Uncharacterized protein n=1 Tax=Deinococcus cellulosilyticus (strain DSM 18568 / NBRC 106333 / KACC 11606 / 5516J-15) TaxID=1223518 RepID=A0A511N0A6_DEIC1|nr:hypothetical protein [Deinococcus cellulosilyticus]GEM45898.1 hypothetical protein DC3_15330 [Deinococcus cellulosilyticus NBRC 106333 = KACC 11606]